MYLISHENHMGINYQIDINHMTIKHKSYINHTTRNQIETRYQSYNHIVFFRHI